MVKRGTMKWVPAVVIDEVEDIKREENIFTDAEAFRQLVRHSRRGRSTARFMTLDFTGFRPRPPVESFPTKLPKRKYKKQEGGILFDQDIF